MKETKIRKGFTIIEVVLVLAIAGLIFLMVFVALPALQRSQRDTQRRDDYGMLSSAITNYSANNGGHLVKLTNQTNVDANKCQQLDASKYINQEGKDPDGIEYALYACTWTGWAAYAGANTKTGAYTKTDVTNAAGSIFPRTNTSTRRDVFVVIGADCTGISNGHDVPKKVDSTRAFAIFGYLESGSNTYCSASQ